MKGIFGKNIFFKVCIIMTLQLFCFGCFAPSKITQEYDIVNSSKRIKWINKFRDYSSESPLISLEQSIIKEIPKVGIPIFSVYDVLILHSNSFNIDKKAFLIIDELVLPISFKVIETDFIKKIDENKEEIMTADSSTINITTGYSEQNSKIFRLKYSLSQEIIEKIYQSNQVSYRYYCGPNMITVKLKGINLKKFKKAMKMV